MDNSYDEQKTPLIQNESNQNTSNTYNFNKMQDQSPDQFNNDSTNYTQDFKKEEIRQLIDQVNLKTQTLRQEKKAKTDLAPYGKILLTYADKNDKIMITVGYIFSILTGIGLPSFVFLFGDIVNSFTDGNILEGIKPTCLQFAIIGAVIWVTSYFYYALLVIMSERVGQKTRVAYLRAILQQDISWFDKTNVTELSARLTKECQAIQKALGEKMGTIQLAFAMCLSGLFFAFFRGWWFSLILFFAFPVLFAMTYIITLAMQSGFMQNLRSYGQSAGYAEQALNAIKVVQAFGMETTEMSNYDKYLGRARATGVRTHMKSALAIAGFFFAMFGYYGYAFYTGSWLVTEKVTNSRTHDSYNAGDIMACFFGVVFGVFSLGMATPNIKAVTEGRVAGKMAYDLIDRVPAIKLDDQSYQEVGSIKDQNRKFLMTFLLYSMRGKQLQQLVHQVQVKVLSFR
ncbi:abc transporter [Stylonychia lemnae]|uniref:Abc transporter n=1 Tax=Stylonychia lemnae TaxID=5949 RepID=A0A078AQ94_STYLE|nr:abc transporter [Stylonychia lemnae]|eukprot:CDW84334.1 abc transporter [Stylonychia lemnae]